MSEASQQMDAEQLKFMQVEHCIIVNEQDQEIGHDSKHFCHLMTNINKGVALHRAFSVFFFDTKGRLMLQQRAAEKITFPLFWTNTCCSHPLYGLPEEMKSAEQTLGDDLGVKSAARRKLEHELGIPQENILPSDLLYLTRLMYKAGFDETWGEHEIDYILIYQSKDDSKFDFNKFNVNECNAVKFVSQEELKQMMADTNLLFTPWCKLIVNNFLWKWWDEMLAGTLKADENVSKIHHLKL